MTAKRTLTRRVVSLLLVFVMLFALALSAAAATKEDVRQYKHYVCIGDSIAAGYGPYASDLLGFETVPEAYHSLVANAVGADFQSLSHVGMRTSEVRALIEDGYTGDIATLYFNGISTYIQWMDSRTSASDPRPDYVSEGMYEAVKDYYGKGSFVRFYRENIQKSDLITVGLGLNDVFLYATKMTGWELDALNTGLNISNILAGMNDAGLAISTLFTVAVDAGVIAFVVPTFLAYMTKGYQTFFQNWVPMMQDLKALAPNATLVALTQYNPFSKMRLTEGSTLEIGKAANLIINNINSYINSNAESVGYLVADVGETEICDTPPMTDGNFIHNILVDCHPTEAGHQYMANQIIGVLPTVNDPIPDPVDPVQPSPSNPTSDFPFTDVVKGRDWFYDDVDYVWRNGLMQGVGGTLFSPGTYTTRDQFAAVVYRLAGEPSVAGLDCPFTDVPANAWYRDAVVWCYNAGIVRGTSDTTFAPGDYITREQMVTMLHRGVGAPEVTGTLSFKDSASISDFARDAVIWSVQNGVINGTDTGYFLPKNNASRGELAAVLHRFREMRINQLTQG